MATTQSYKTDAWGFTVTWGRDVTGDGDQDTEVYFEPMGPLPMDDAVAMADQLREVLVGNDD